MQGVDQLEFRSNIIFFLGDNFVVQQRLGNIPNVSRYYTSFAGVGDSWWVTAFTFLAPQYKVSTSHIITVTESGAATPISLRKFDSFTAIDVYLQT